MVRVIGVLLFLVILLFAADTGLATAADDRAPAEYRGPIAEKPTLTIGDYWVSESETGRGQVKWEYAGVEDGKLVFRSGKRKDLLHTTPELLILRRVHGKTGEVMYENPPGNQGCFQFPLWVGKSWWYTYPVRSRDFHVDVPIDVRCTVTAHEDVSVKAGTFRAFRVQRDWQARGYTDAGSNTYWYAPEVKNIIRGIEGASIGQLVEYRVSR